MYICICKAVTDGQIREAVRQGCCTQKDLVRCLDVGRDCGKCRSDVRDLLEQFSAEEAMPPVSSPCNRPTAPILHSIQSP